ncbi:MAG TPA: Flp family type IVb pilin [Firmicutes bacterium]|nr:Flp family type IVb pilin [Bacillota bacterium]
MIKRLFQEEAGQGMVEYGLIIALVAIAVIVVLQLMGGSLNKTFTNIKDKLEAANTSS